MKNMKLVVLTLGLIVAFLSKSVAFSQDGWQTKVSFTSSIEKIDDSHGYLIIKAKLIPGWHIFSVNHDASKADGTGMITKVYEVKNPAYKFEGKLMDGKKASTHVEPGVGTSVYFENEGIFKQKFVVLKDSPFKLEYDLEFQVCDENGCVFPPAQRFSVEVKNMKAEMDAALDVDTSSQVHLTNEPEKENVSSANPKQDKLDAVGTVFDDGKGDKKKDNNFLIFIAGFLAGLVALLTPCMFPMIPMTVSFFTKQSKTRSEGIRKALIYGFSIIAIYVTFGLIFTALAGSMGLNDLSTNMWMNLIFFIIFILFAFSFLGAFEIQLPSSWVNKMDAKADKGGYIGIFFMAFTLGLVSFSCTGPIVGSLLVEAATTGSYFTPAVGMTGFSLALAIPFTLFAIFPGWMNSLPQSGGWLNSVKVVLGLLELALALKFFSAVDQAYHWNVLTREWFVGIWFVVFLVMGLYLLGKIKFAHDSVIEKLSVTRFMFAFFALTFAVYLLPGMFGAPLQLIDGIGPPRTISEDNFRFVNGGLETGLENDTIAARFKKDMHPVGDGSILAFHDLEKAREYARLKNLPILVDFTGYACNNCRKTESSIWLNDKVRPMLQTEIVVASLYCDDKTPLPDEEVYYSEKSQGTIRTIGNKWADIQITKYKKFQQPLYIISDFEGNDLTKAREYNSSVEGYQQFLKTGIQRYYKKHPKN